MVSGKTRDRQQLLDSSKGLPCILMAQDPSPQDILAGIKLGAVDFLAKPLCLTKLQNIWQHTVRKMMSNMNINCSEAAATAHTEAVTAVEPAAVATAAVKKELDEMEVIMEDPEAELAAVSGTSKAQTVSKPADTAADVFASQRAQKVKETVPNAALAAASSFFEPTKCLSRSTSLATADSTATVAPGSPAKTAAVGVGQQKKHGAVHSCPSSRSLNSMSSCYSNLLLSVPQSPSATESGDGTEDQAPQPSAATAVTFSPASSPSPFAHQQQRSVKKAVRHPMPATPASKPPLGKPQQSSQLQKAGNSASGKGSAMGPCSGATTAGPLPVNVGMTSVPLPTGLGPLPQGMVWGMPMCPLARAPGIVPPKSTGTSNTGSCNQQAATTAGSSATAATGMMGMPPMGMPWGMMGMPMPMGMPNPFMPGFMMPHMAMAMPFGPFAASSMPGFAGQAPGFDPQQMQVASGAAALQQDAAAAAAAPVPYDQMPQSGAATGAAAAAALNASWNADACIGSAEHPAGGMDLNEAFDFMLGDIAAEDDLDVGMSGLLDGELAQLEKDGLKLPTELQELQACQQQQELQQLQQQQQQHASFECSTMTHHNSSQRISFDCHSARQRVSFDCSSASTATAGRLSFDCSSANPTSRPAKSQRVSFEVNCPAGRPACNIATQSSMTAAQAGQACSAAIAAFEQGSDPLLGSMSDLFAAGSGGDSCSEGSNGMTHVDSCGMLADLQSLFGPGDCSKDEGCSTAAAAAAGLFDDVMDELPLELAMKKSSSLAELLNAGLSPMHA
eukprot:GHUV01005431.1.p1 GENE.GHUV01005431.1~~GHUV01005431.1.p1  ORF type:complete len:788 (+),score=342.73 GHUV01005431.1:251-2614(+)